MLLDEATSSIDIKSEEIVQKAIETMFEDFTVITIATLYQAKPVTPLHLFGVALSVFGTLLYQQCGSWYPAAEAGYELVPLSAERGAPVEAKPTRREGGALLVWPGEEQGT